MESFFEGAACMATPAVIHEQGDALVLGEDVGGELFDLLGVSDRLGREWRRRRWACRASARVLASRCRR